MKKILAFLSVVIISISLFFVFGGCNNETTDKKFYTLSEAYKNSYITKADVQSVYSF
mgnify:CR=1 FL=1